MKGKITTNEVLAKYSKRWDSRKKVNNQVVKMILKGFNDVIKEILLDNKNFVLPMIGKFKTKIKINYHAKIRIATRKSKKRGFICKK